MNAADTSVAVAAFASWHERHDAALEALSGGSRLITHVALETYAVLTRLPPPHRAPPALVVEFLERSFREAPISLPPGKHRDLVARAAASGTSGGAVYDALIAAAAAHAGATLLTLDRRALAVYERFGAQVRSLA